jgi:hypothetical protein
MRSFVKYVLVIEAEELALFLKFELIASAQL